MLMYDAVAMCGLRVWGFELTGSRANATTRGDLSQDWRSFFLKPAAPSIIRSGQGPPPAAAFRTAASGADALFLGLLPRKSGPERLHLDSPRRKGSSRRQPKKGLIGARFSQRPSSLRYGVVGCGHVTMRTLRRWRHGLRPNGPSPHQPRCFLFSLQSPGYPVITNRQPIGPAVGPP